MAEGAMAEAYRKSALNRTELATSPAAWLPRLRARPMTWIGPVPSGCRSMVCAVAGVAVMAATPNAMPKAKNGPCDSVMLAPWRIGSCHVGSALQLRPALRGGWKAVATRSVMVDLRGALASGEPSL